MHIQNLKIACYSADYDTPKPHILISMADQQEAVPHLGYRQTVEIYPITDAETFIYVDELEKRIKDILHRNPLKSDNGNVTLNYIGIAADEMKLKELNILTKGLLFECFFNLETDNGGGDPGDGQNAEPWIHELAEWTRLNFPGLNICENVLDSGYDLPTVLFRAESEEYKGGCRGANFRYLKVRGHVITKDEKQAYNIAINLTYKLHMAHKIYGANKWLTVSDSNVDPKANPFIAGQIGLTLMGTVKRELKTAPLLEKIKIREGGVTFG